MLVRAAGRLEGVRQPDLVEYVAQLVDDYVRALQDNKVISSVPDSRKFWCGSGSGYTEQWLLEQDRSANRFKGQPFEISVNFIPSSNYCLGSLVTGGLSILHCSVFFFENNTQSTRQNNHSIALLKGCLRCSKFFPYYRYQYSLWEFYLFYTNMPATLKQVGGGSWEASSAAAGGRGNPPPGTINSPGRQFTWNSQQQCRSRLD